MTKKQLKKIIVKYMKENNLKHPEEVTSHATRIYSVLLSKELVPEDKNIEEVFVNACYEQAVAYVLMERMV